MIFYCLIGICENDAESNYTGICGKGAINCTRFVLKPRYECDTENHYFPSADGRMCIQGIFCLFVIVHEHTKILRWN